MQPVMLQDYLECLPTAGEWSCLKGVLQESTGSLSQLTRKAAAAGPVREARVFVPKPQLFPGTKSRSYDKHKRDFKRTVWPDVSTRALAHIEAHFSTLPRGDLRTPHLPHATPFSCITDPRRTFWACD